MNSVNSPDQQNRSRLLPGESGVPTQVADQLQANLTNAEAARQAALQQEMPSQILCKVRSSQRRGF